MATALPLSLLRDAPIGMPSDPIGQILLGCMRSPLDETCRQSLLALTSSEWEQLLARAAQHQLDPFIGHRLRAVNLSTPSAKPSLERLQQTLRQNAIRNLRLIVDLKGILVAMKAAALDPILLKGPHLLIAGYCDPAMRRITDIDLWLPEPEIARAAEVLQAIGYRAKMPVSPVRELSHHFHHLPMFYKDGATSVELHWSIAPPESSAVYGANLDSDSIAARTVVADLGGCSVRLLSKEDLILHLAHHALLHQFTVGLKSLVDITQVVLHAAVSINWQAVVERGRAWGISRSLLIELTLARRIVGAPIPARVLDELGQGEVDESLFECALDLMLADPSRTVLVSPRVIKFAGAPWFMRFGELASAIFISRQLLARHYKVSARPPGIYLYYLVRCRDLIVRYSRTVARHHRGDASTIDLVEKKARLLEFVCNR